MNYYELLNVPETATNAEIKKSYKSLVKKYHPDVYDGDKTFAEKKTKELNQAYEILSDKSSRAEYDRVLNSAREEYSSIIDNDNISNSNNYDEDLNDFNNNTYNNSYSSLKEEIEKRYQRMYNYDYYKKYTTNYYGVDKSNEKNYSNTANDNQNTFHNFVNKFILESKNKVLIFAIAFILIVALLFAIFLLHQVRILLNASNSNIPEDMYTDEYQDYNTTTIPQEPATPYQTNIYGGYSSNSYSDYDYSNMLGEYENYLYQYLYQDFDGVVEEGVTYYQILSFYGDADSYSQVGNYIYAYYQTSYIIYNQSWIVVGYSNNGYFLTNDDSE